MRPCDDDYILTIDNYPVGELEPVPVIRQRAEWKQFIVLVWQWQNDVDWAPCWMIEYVANVGFDVRTGY